MAHGRNPKSLKSSATNPGTSRDVEERLRRAREAWLKESVETPRFRQRLQTLTEPHRGSLGVAAPACPEEPRWRAIHEAGHTVAQFLLKGTIPEKVTISRMGGAVQDFGNFALAAILCGDAPISLDQVAPDIDVYLAGIAAESLVATNPQWELAQSDLNAANMFIEYVEDAAPDCLEGLLEPTVQLLVDNWDLVVNVASALVSKPTLRAEQVQSCIGMVRHQNP